MAASTHETEQALNLSALSNLPFNIYSSSNTGILKGCKLKDESWHNINKIRNASKDSEIKCMCWGNDEGSIFTGCRNSSVFNYMLDSPQSGTLSLVPLTYVPESAVMREIKNSGTVLTTAFSNGIVKSYNFGSSDKNAGYLHRPLTQIEIFADKDLYCMDQSVSSPNLIATGGKENALKMWDITKSDHGPTFVAKNVKNDWLNLRVPIWITKLQFYPDGNKIITGTGHSQIRLYDPSTPQRRPVIEMKCGENPITALAVRPNSDYQLVVGNTVGYIGLADLRKKGIVKTYKGTRGGISDIKCHPLYPTFVCCSVDRYVYCFDVDYSKKPLHSMFVHASQNCLLVSSEWSISDYTTSRNLRTISAVDSSVKSEFDAPGSGPGEEVDKIWDSMKVVQTKKRQHKSVSKEGVKKVKK